MFSMFADLKCHFTSNKDPTLQLRLKEPFPRRWLLS